MSGQATGKYRRGSGRNSEAPDIFRGLAQEPQKQSKEIKKWFQQVAAEEGDPWRERSELLFASLHEVIGHGSTIYAYPPGHRPHGWNNDVLSLGSLGDCLDEMKKLSTTGYGIGVVSRPSERSLQTGPTHGSRRSRIAAQF